MNSTLKYTLHIWGDVHVGSGFGLPGILDDRVVRDDDGFAFIPASEIKGLVRQACADLVHYRQQAKTLLCSGQLKWQLLRVGPKGEPLEPGPNDYCHPDGELCLLCALFGSPLTPGAWWFSPAHYPDHYRKAVGQIEALSLAERDMASSAHASIDPKTKRAAEQKLFNLEVVQPADIFQGEIMSLGVAGAARLGEQALRAWLVASLLFTRRLGGRRRRGWGRCRFTISEEAMKPVKDWLGD